MLLLLKYTALQFMIFLDECVVICWSVVFCFLPAALAMSLYDVDRTKRLSRDDVYGMLKDIHGWKLEQHHTE
jgi:hypothetical protein